VIAHTSSRRAKSPRQVQSMSPERSLPAGAIFAPSDVTQPQFEAKTKDHCHSERSEECAIHFEPYPAMKIRPKMFRFAQHDSCNSFLA